MKIQLDGTGDIYEAQASIRNNIDDFSDGAIGFIALLLAIIGACLGMLSAMVLAYNIMLWQPEHIYTGLRGLGISTIFLCLTMVRLELHKLEK